MKQNASRIALLAIALWMVIAFSPAIARAVINRFFPERLLPTTGLVAPKTGSDNEA